MSSSGRGCEQPAYGLYDQIGRLREISLHIGVLLQKHIADAVAIHRRSWSRSSRWRLLDDVGMEF